MRIGSPGYNLAAECCGGQDPADRWLRVLAPRVDQPEVRGERTRSGGFRPPGQMPCMLVETVEIEECARLLDDEDLCARGKDRVKLRRR